MCSSRLQAGLRRISGAGWVFWRAIGCGRIPKHLNWVRAVATALVAAVIAKLILYPTGVLEQSPLWLRLGAVAAGAVAFFIARQKPAIGIATAIGVLAVGLYALGF